MRARNLVFFAVFILLATVALADGPEPAPWWQRVEETQSLALKWIGSLTVVLGALATLVAFVIGKVNELKARVEAQSHRVDTQQTQITTLAQNAPPPQPPNPNPQ